MTDRLVELTERFVSVRRKTEDLCAPLGPEDHLLSVTEETSPPKWHLAHTSWFFEHFLLEKLETPDYGYLFNSYYKQIGNYLPKSKRGFLSRPSTEEIYRYRSSVTEAVVKLLSTTTGTEADRLCEVLEIGINHEQQHQELLLMDIKRNFFQSPLRPAYQVGRSEFQKASGVQEFRSFPEGLVKIGVPKEGVAFAYDNEKDEHSVWLEAFQLSTHLVTNGEFFSFIEDGGYDRPEFWLSDGWDHKEKEQWTQPLYWEQDNGQWMVMGLNGMAPLDPEAPVAHVSYYEAQAFAKWKGCRLPSEAEWETAARLEPVAGEFLDSSSSQHKLFSQIHGTLWEWTTSPYAPFPRYEALGHGLGEYNEKFMCNQFVLRGGCSATPKSHYRLTYRNFYYPHMRWMYGGIRLAKEGP